MYGLQCHGLDPWNEPDRTVEAMVARYVDAIRAVQPSGPYEVVGYSMGGLIAVEIARRLLVHGDRVDLTGVVDTVPPGVALDPIDCATALSLISRAVGLLPVFVGDPSKPDEELMAEFIVVAVERGALMPGFRIRDLKPMVELYVVNGAAANAYRLGSFAGRICCLFTRGGDAGEYVNVWRGLSGSDVQVDVLEADHFALMHEQHAAAVATVLSRWIGEL